MKGMLIIISGPSGSGKGTVVKNLDPSRNYALSISVTTRKPRENERDGIDYFFCTEEEFVQKRDNNELLEHAVYVGSYYGTPRHYVEEQIAKGKAVVLEIEVNGALQVKEKFPEAVLIFLLPPSKMELYRRLINRKTEEASVIEYRLKRANEEVRLIPKYDYLVINDNLDDAVKSINTIVDAESLKPSRNQDFIVQFENGEAF